MFIVNVGVKILRNINSFSTIGKYNVNLLNNNSKKAEKCRI